VARVRVRQHVNPLANKYAEAIAPPDWSQVYADPNRPLHLDIGCGWGDFLFHLAKLEPEWNFLGLEIRQPLVDIASQQQKLAGLDNLGYLFCNANNSLEPILASLPTHCLSRVSIQFPDPWFKNRHFKRRVVQPEVVETLARYLQPGSMAFLQSDVELVERDMCDRFHAHPAFEYIASTMPAKTGTIMGAHGVRPHDRPLDINSEDPPNPEEKYPGLLSTPNPFPVPTEREKSTLSRGEPVYRAIFHTILPNA
jgi:tRNA (guanine-N7-)-methyltransferase